MAKTKIALLYERLSRPSVKGKPPPAARRSAPLTAVPACAL